MAELDAPRTALVELHHPRVVWVDFWGLTMEVFVVYMSTCYMIIVYMLILYMFNCWFVVYMLDDEYTQEMNRCALIM